MLATFAKPAKYFLLLTLPSLLVLFFVAELFFRFVIPAADPPHAYFDKIDQILRYDVDGPRSGRNTVGNLAQVQSNWRVNNMGWLSDIDYATEGRQKPLVAIIGDSQVAALLVDSEDHLAAQLRRSIGDEFDVYSFGTSGAPLSQYLNMARYVRKEFNPDVLVFSIMHNDFHQSLCDFQRLLGMLCLIEADTVMQEAEIYPYTPNRTRRMTRNSSLVRYLFLNLNLSARFRRSAPQDDPRFAPPDAESQKDLEARIEKSVDYTLSRIAQENQGSKVIFMMDAPRRYIYSGELNQLNEFEISMNRLMERQTAKHGFSFLDLTGPFGETFAVTQKKFEFEIDFHWNDYGHATAAVALEQMLREGWDGQSNTLGRIPPNEESVTVRCDQVEPIGGQGRLSCQYEPVHGLGKREDRSGSVGGPHGQILPTVFSIKGP